MRSQSALALAERNRLRRLLLWLPGAFGLLGLGSHLAGPAALPLEAGLPRRKKPPKPRDVEPDEDSAAPRSEK